MGAFNKAANIYEELTVLLNKEIYNLDDYLDIVENYVNIKSVRVKGELNAEFEKNNIEYSMYNGLIDKESYKRFVEDCAMMIYRLNGGEGYNTYTLIDELKN